jgi:hypothetical protein
MVSGSQTAFQLAGGLCDAVTSGRIISLEYGFSCPTKTVDTPVCAPPATAPAATSFDTSACHKCVYDPPECAPARAAITGTPATWVTQAFACAYDGYYDSAAECGAVRGCFLGQLEPYLSCQGAACDDPSLTGLETWIACLNQTDRVTACKAECDAEGANVCPAGI